MSGDISNSDRQNQKWCHTYTYTYRDTQCNKMKYVEGTWPMKG